MEETESKDARNKKAILKEGKIKSQVKHSTTPKPDIKIISQLSPKSGKSKILDAE